MSIGRAAAMSDDFIAQNYAQLIKSCTPRERELVEKAEPLSLEEIQELFGAQHFFNLLVAREIHGRFLRRRVSDQEEEKGTAAVR